ncbi:hypothetical protein H8B02_17440 [Bradyrhizobium sp. Pear77]|uniref:hypothetical protein n=1 Tax=Bradyrhizobium altum TaxID=1571202 RepID=UPI001E57E5F8|nr:hypothetical protein [Bradyrhizobium altum]MCC8955163.1 hypothetical protein [Bradyrhizobium altum]
MLVSKVSPRSIEAMDDYRDLVAAAFGLACAGVMLVAGELYLEHRAMHAEVRQVQPSVEKAQGSRVASSGKDAKSDAPS